MDGFKYLIFATHKNSEKTFLFEASPYLPLKNGDFVEVETAKGVAEATCVGEPFFIESKGLTGLTQATGAYLPLKKVIAKVEYKTVRNVKSMPDEGWKLPF